MALTKNKTGIMAAINAVSIGSPTPQERAERTLPKGTIGSVRAGLGGIQEIETSLILPWGPDDRLELTAVNSGETPESIDELAESIASSGQQVPVLLRPSAKSDGKFEVIYGRRRILACVRLGIPVKALIRTLDDRAALMAKGLENASRTDLSFYERARFARAILEQGYDRAEACQALAISKNTLSQLERVSRLVPDGVGALIGPAPGAGRPKWMALGAAFESGRLSEKVAVDVIGRLAEDVTSDERLEAVLAEVSRRAARPPEQAERVPAPGVTVKSKGKTLILSVQRDGKNKAFADWLDQNLDDLVSTAFERFQSENRRGQGG